MNPQFQLMLQQAIQAFQNGNLDSSTLILKRILQVDSKNLPALHVMGLIHASQANYKEAAVFLGRAARISPNDASIQYNLAKALSDSGNDRDALLHHKKAVTLDPNNPEAWLSYGKSASNLGRYEEALIWYGNALSLKPDYAEASLNKGATLKELKRYEEAVTLAAQALAINPHLAEAWANKGVALKELKRYDEAIAHYDRAIGIKPDYAEAWTNKGLTLNELKRYAEAIAHYDRAIDIKPDYAEAWVNKGVTLYELKRYDEAIAHYDRAIDIKPDYAEAWVNKGVTLHELKRYDEAIAHYDRAIGIKPDYAEAWTNKGLTLNELKRYAEAIAHYDRAIDIKPDYAEAWTNKGLTLNELKRYAEAIAHYDRAIGIKPDYAEAWTNKGLLNLFLQHYQTGWQIHDWRLRMKDWHLTAPIDQLASWDGAICQHLLIFSEQGIGDIIFYSSILKSLKNKAKKITALIDRRLLPILSRSFPEIIFADSNRPLNACLYDAQISFGSLAAIFDMHPSIDGRVVPYIIDNHELTKTLKDSSNNKLKCGVAWKSNNPRLGKDKSLLLSDLNSILKLQDYEFINLQYGDTQEEIRDLEGSYGVKLSTIDGIDLFENIDGLLSIIKMCDVIVTTSNLTAHLAGALGKNTLLLVPYMTGRIWYWHEEKVSSWYPSISLYSQDENLQWSGAIENILYRLKNGPP